jgi:O-antigen ligase
VLAVAIQMIIATLFFIYSKRSAFLGAGLSRRSRVIGIAALAIVAIVVTVAGTTLWLGGDQLATGVETAAIEMSAKTGDHHEGARRRDIWRATLRMARAHPIAGAGLGSYWAEIPVYHDASGGLTPQQAHSEYLELLASGGLIGVGLFAWFMVAVVQRIQRALRTYAGVQRAFAVGAIIGILGVAVHSLVDFGLHMMGNALVFVMLLAILSLTTLDQRVMAQAHRKGSFN